MAAQKMGRNGLPLRPDDSDPVAVWVWKLNRLADEMDEKCSWSHPSSWDELTKSDREEFRRIVAEGPGELCQNQDSQLLLLME